MATTVRVKADNTDEWRAAFRAALREGLEECGMWCESAAKKGCPVDTGRLRASYGHEVEEDGRSVVVGTPVEYGKFVEMGTSRTRAQPHLRPAAQQGASRYAEILRAALGGR